MQFASAVLLCLLKLDCSDGAMSYADTAAMAILGSCEDGNAVVCAFLKRLNLKTEGGAFLNADAAAVT